MTKIYLIRHAESEGNAYRRAHGHYNGQIVDMGFLQIEALRKRFDGIKIDCIYSSDLDRTCTTATALSEPRGLKINKSDLLREVNMGVWEDHAWGDLEHNDPEMVKFFNADPSKWSAEGSESYEHVQSRMLKSILSIGKTHAGESVAVFSHGFAIKSLICLLLGIKPHEAYKVPYFDNTAVTLLNYDDSKLTIEYQGDNSHLSDDISTFARQTWWRKSGERVKENLRYALVDSFDKLEFFDNAILKEIEALGSDMVFQAFLDTDSVGVFALDSAGDDIGTLSYYYIKPKHSVSNFLDQFIGQAISVFRKQSKNVLQVQVRAKDEVLNSLFARYDFTKSETKGEMNILMKEL